MKTINFLNIIGGTCMLISTPMLVTSCNDNKYVPSHFETDPGDTICYFANKGLDALKDAYKQGYADNGNTFVGLTRIININNTDHVLRVVGQNHDYIANQDGTASSTPAALTFEFITCLSYGPDDSQTLNIPGDTSIYGNANYGNSNVWHALNSTDNLVTGYKDNEVEPVENCPSVIQMIESNNSGATNIKNVSRTVSVHKPTGAGEAVTNGERVFLPSLGSYFPEEQLQEVTPPTVKEDSQYDFYKNLSGNPMAKSPELERYSANPGATLQVWLSTPGSGDEMMVGYNSGGYIGSDRGSRTDLAIAPLFAI